jgi:hypothetical protein
MDPIHPWYTLMAGCALIATAALAGVATVVIASTGPAMRAPIVPTERTTGAMMFRRMRMFCLHAFAKVKWDDLGSAARNGEVSPFTVLLILTKDRISDIGDIRKNKH